MSDSPDLRSFRQHYELAEKLIAKSTKAEIAVVARLLAINCAYFDSKYGVQLLDGSVDMAAVEKPDAKTAKLLSDGMQTLCAVMGIVIGDAESDSFRH